MATVQPSPMRREVVHCGVCRELIVMPAFVILRGVMMCPACERVQGRGDARATGDLARRPSARRTSRWR